MEALRAGKFLQRTTGIKTLINAGVVIKAKVLDAELGGFTLEFEAKDHDQDIKLMHAREPRIKVFKGIEAAITYCRRDLGLMGGIEVLA